MLINRSSVEHHATRRLAHASLELERRAADTGALFTADDIELRRFGAFGIRGDDTAGWVRCHDALDMLFRLLGHYFFSGQIRF